jgi:hypothetical protein
MKLICYSLFNGKKEKFEKLAYIRGFYFNVRMNRLIYPSWNTYLAIDQSTYDQYKLLFDRLNIIINVFGHAPQLCEGMLWRMYPIWSEGVSHILCRDSDAITTYREAQLVNIWQLSDSAIHAILDNHAHGGLMGGMVGFKTEYFKSKFHSWDEMVNGSNLSKHGSDQNLLNTKVLPSVRDKVMWSNATGLDGNSWPKLPGVDQKLWESNLTCRHIGSAGVVEMETLRFFKRFDSGDSKWIDIERLYPEIFYWHL